MNLLMISGDRSLITGRRGAFWYTLDELRKHFVQIDIITPKPKKGIPLHPNPFDNVHIHPSPFGLWYQPIWIAREGKRLTTQHQYAAMTVHDYPPFYNGIGGAQLHKKTGIPYVIEIHHVVGWPTAANLTERIGRFLSKRYLAKDTANAAAVRTVNTAVKQLLQTWGIRKPISVVPSIYLDHEVLRPDPAIEKKYDLVCCARLDPNKGIDKVLQALVLLPNISLFIIGDGPQRKALERQAAKAGIANRVTFAGWLPDSHYVIRAMQSAKICVVNSTSEGGPRIALEAMALGMPLITTPVGLMPDLIRHGQNGLLTTGAPDNLAANVTALLGNPELQKTIGKAAQEVLHHFERKAAIKAYADFIKSLIGPILRPPTL